MNLDKFALLLAALVFAGCASPPSGGGPTYSVINGVDVWKGGPPPRPYNVVKNVNWQGADGSVNFAQQEQSLASQASDEGADAVVVTSEVMAVGRYNLANGAPIMSPKVAAELVKYQ